MKASKHIASEASGKKKKGALSLDTPKWQMDPVKHRLLGYRTHDENEKDFPTVSLLVPDEAMGRRWAAERIQSGKHADCGFQLELVLFDTATYHVLSRCGHLPDDPLVGPIDWVDGDPVDIGPLWEQMTIEAMREIEGMPPAAIEAAQLALKQQRPIYTNDQPEAKAPAKGKEKTEAKAKDDTAKNGKPRAKQSGGKSEAKPETEAPNSGSTADWHPVPKPGQAGKSAKGRGGGKSAPAKRAIPQKLRAVSKSKHTKRA